MGLPTFGVYSVFQTTVPQKRPSDVTSFQLGVFRSKIPQPQTPKCIREPETGTDSACPSTRKQPAPATQPAHAIPSPFP